MATNSRSSARSTGRHGSRYIVAAIDLARELGAGKVVTTVAVDTGLKYLAGDLFVE